MGGGQLELDGESMQGGSGGRVSLGGILVYVVASGLVHIGKSRDYQRC